MVKTCSENLEACEDCPIQEKTFTRCLTMSWCVEKKDLLNDQVKSGDSVLILALIIRLLYIWYRSVFEECAIAVQFIIPYIGVSFFPLLLESIHLH